MFIIRGAELFFEFKLIMTGLILKLTLHKVSAKGGHTKEYCNNGQLFILFPRLHYKAFWKLISTRSLKIPQNRLERSSLHSRGARQFYGTKFSKNEREKTDTKHFHNSFLEEMLKRYVGVHFLILVIDHQCNVFFTSAIM